MVFGIERDSLFTALRSFLNEQTGKMILINLPDLTKELLRRGLIFNGISPNALDDHLCNDLTKLYDVYNAFEFPFRPVATSPFTQCRLNRGRILAILEGKKLRKSTGRRIPAHMRCEN